MQVFRSYAALVAAVLLGGCAPLPDNSVSRLDQSVINIPDFETPSDYTRLLSPNMHNFRAGRIEAGDPVRAGTRSERFELRDGDCGGTDCIEPRSRAEIQIFRSRSSARIGQEIWYGYSFYNATVPSFTEKNSLRLVFGQWTAGGENTPAFRFIQLGKGEGNFKACDPAICAEPRPGKGDLVVHLGDVAKANGWGDAQNNGYICRLFDIKERIGSWVDLTVNTNFSAGPDGFLKIWVDDVQVCDYAGPVISRQSLLTEAHPRHRRGIFSSWNKRWRKATGDARKPNLIVYYDEYNEGPTRADVDVRNRIALKQAAID